MNKFKAQIIAMMRPIGHKHLSMTDAIACRECAPRVRKAKELYDKVVRKNPEILARSKPVFKPSEELKEMWDKLQERVKYDKLYKKHLEKSFKGTVEEQNKEADKVNEGFYEKNTEWTKKQIISPIQMNKQEQEIAELNGMIKANLGVSKIHGIGVFAVRDILKGEKVYADRMSRVYHIPYGSFGKLFPEARKIITERWPNVIHGEGFVYPDARLISFMNHSDTPNYDPVTDTALKAISAGEEITENYCIVKDAEKIYPWLVCKNML